jgi:hypothetical protein
MGGDPGSTRYLFCYSPRRLSSKTKRVGFSTYATISAMGSAAARAYLTITLRTPLHPKHNPLDNLAMRRRTIRPHFKHGTFSSS